MSTDSILVWMLSLNREYSRLEYDQVYRLCKLCFPNESFRYEYANPDSFRLLVTQLLVALMMRHRQLSRSKWQDHRTPTGKRWIEIRPSGDPNQSQPLNIGYHLTYQNSLCGMAITQGTQLQGVHIGLGIKQRKVEPQGTPVKLYLESLSHKLTQVEMANIIGNPDDLMLKRLCTLLALKEAYLKALGMPTAFDFTRLEFDVPNQRVLSDGYPVLGWEFRVFTSKLGVARGAVLKQEEYECVCAFYTGAQESTYIFHATTAELESWVQYINIDQLMVVSNKLAE